MRAARDYRVFLIEEPIFEGDTAGVRESARGDGIVLVQPILPPGTPEDAAIAHQRAIAETIAARADGAPLLVWYYTPMALAFGRDLNADLVVFDKMDELSAFAFAPPALQAREAEMMATADLVFTGGAALQAAAAGWHPAVHCFPSSIDAAHFGRARRGVDADPQDQAMIGGPRIGFFGVIDERIDLPLIAQVAAMRAEWQLVMIGPTAKIDPASLPRAANIHWLGGRAYADLPAYLAHWDLGWMPFAKNDATRFISPTKTPEFLAAGLPLLSTSIADVVEPYGRLGLVAIADTAAAMVAAGDRLLAEAGAPAKVAARRAAVDAHLDGNSWDATWAAMQALIDDAARAARPSARTIQREETLLV